MLPSIACDNVTLPNGLQSVTFGHELVDPMTGHCRVAQDGSG